MYILDFNFASLFISGAAAIIAVFSFYFAIKSWRETNRPIVTARVTTHASGNVSTMLDLIIENTGNRPAKEVNLTVDSNEIGRIILAKEDNPLRQSIYRCFANDTFIPILENGRSVSNSFGILRERENESTWRHNSILHINLIYEDLDGRKFKHNIPLLITNDIGFAGSFWRRAE